MAFPASPSNNDVHKEGSRSFVYDSTLAVWDQTKQLSGHGIGSDKTLTQNVPYGNIIQVKCFNYATEHSTSSNSWSDTGLEGWIAMSTTSNKILVTFSVNGVAKETNNTETQIGSMWKIGSAASWGTAGTTAFGSRNAMTGSTAKNNVGSVVGTYMISPGTLTMIGVKILFCSASNLASAQVQEANATSQLTLMEVVS